MNCNLCPRACGAERDNGIIGFCGVGSTPIVGRIAPHLWEEPCICTGSGSGTVFFSGCNLRCSFCQNGKISNGKLGREMTEKELAEAYISLQDMGVSNINFVTPTPWVPNIKRSLDLAWEMGLYLPTVYNCGGYESVEALRSLNGYIGVYLPDFKYMDAELGRRFSGVGDYPEVAKRALYEMVDQRGEAVYNSDGTMVKGVIVRHLVLPNHVDDSIRVLDYLHREYGDSIVISIMSQYTPQPNAPGELNRKLTAEEYDTVVNYAESIGIKNAYIQDGESASESFIPEFG
ncbi:MAG: radical SAM protein [Ruminococcaceae bacterium]|nr:radical SAM protein [Oscillospiraceae bacterium]